MMESRVGDADMECVGEGGQITGFLCFLRKRCWHGKMAMHDSRGVLRIRSCSF
jgi:hypothetical protein